MRVLWISSIAILTTVAVQAQMPLQVAMGTFRSPGAAGNNFRTPPEYLVEITNPNSVRALGVAFSNTLPPGLIIGSSGGLSGGTNGPGCAGQSFVNARSGDTAWSFSSGIVEPNSTCEVWVAVSSDTPGSYTDTLPAGAVTSSNEPANTSPASATVVISSYNPPALQKTLSQQGLYPGDAILLRIDIANDNNPTMNDVSFTDIYPSGMVNAANPAPSSNCSGAVITAVPGGDRFSVSGAAVSGYTFVPGPGRCFMQLTVTTTAAGSFTNTIPAGAVSSDLGSNTSPASATVVMSSPPHVDVSKAFNPSEIVAGSESRLTITLHNPTSSTATGVSFTDNYVPLHNAPQPSAQSTCGGTVTATPGDARSGGSSVALTGGTVPAGGTCTVSVSVTGAPGTYTNTIAAGDVKTSNGAPNPADASATLTITTPPHSIGISKMFEPALIRTGGRSRLTITLSNPNAQAVTGLFVNDLYPSGLVNAPLPDGETTCGGTVSASAGDFLALSGGSLAANGTCTVSVDVTSAAVGELMNTISASSYGADGVVSAAGTSARLIVLSLAAPTVRLAFDPPSIAVGGTSMLTFSLFNPNADAVHGIQFNSVYSSGLVNAGGNVTSDCGGFVVAPSGAASASINAITLAAGGSCTIRVPVTSATAGVSTAVVRAGDMTSSDAPPNDTDAKATLMVGAAKHRAAHH